MKDVCLFAHFDRDNKVDEYVFHYLRQIRQLEFSIIFISTVTLRPADITHLYAECSDVILRENTGLDFGSWSVGFRKHESKISGRLLLANDSVYGPIGNLATAFHRLTAVPADFYGLVESIERRTPHLQSWFVLFEPYVAQSAELRAILSQSFSTMTKDEIINNGELGLTRRLTALGFKYNALYLPSRSGLTARFFPANPMHVLWYELLVCEQIPFLKIELLRDNPIHLEDKETIMSALKEIDFSLYRLVKDHLARSAPRSDRSSRLSRYGHLVNNLRFALMRKGYDLWSEHEHVSEAWNFIKVFAIVAIFLLWKGLRSLRMWAQFFRAKPVD